VGEFSARPPGGKVEIKAMGAILSGRLRRPEDAGEPHKFNDLAAHLSRSVEKEERALGALIATLVDSRAPRAESVITIIGECFAEYGDPGLLRRMAEYGADGDFDRHAVITRLWAKLQPEQEAEPDDWKGRL
jgi:hypothetical protein